MRLWPTRRQWRSWSLPSKLTAIGTLMGIIGILVAVLVYILQVASPTRTLSGDDKEVIKSAVREVLLARATSFNALSELITLHTIVDYSRPTTDTEVVYADLAYREFLDAHGGLDGLARDFVSAFEPIRHSTTPEARACADDILNALRLRFRKIDLQAYPSLNRFFPYSTWDEILAVDYGRYVDPRSVTNDEYLALTVAGRLYTELLLRLPKLVKEQ